jgi:trehalose 2-sulfotransferase
MSLPLQSYIICCTPRSGSHLLAGGLDSSGIAGHPNERFPRLSSTSSHSPSQADRLVTQPPPESSYDHELDSEYVRSVIKQGMTQNGVFGITIHWFQLNDAVRRIHSYLGTFDVNPFDTLSSVFPNLSYIWLRRRDKIAQAVSWYKAIQTGQYVALADEPEQVLTNEIVFDFKAIKTYWSALRSFDNGWNYFFSSNRVDHFTVDYEDLTANYAPTVRAVLRYLKLNDAMISIGAPLHRKQSNQQSREWTEKFRDLLR